MLNDPVNFVDPLGLDISLQWHAVQGKNLHTLIRITPENQAKYINDPRFHNKDALGNNYLTIGAGPIPIINGRLVSNINRDSDILLHPKDSTFELNNGCQNEDQLISDLLLYNANYMDNLDYDLFPANSQNAKWYLPDDGYNSNSYISGLLSKAGIKKPKVTDTPGWDKPVPLKYFNPRKSF